MGYLERRLGSCLDDDTAGHDQQGEERGENRDISNRSSKHSVLLCNCKVEEFIWHGSLELYDAEIWSGALFTPEVRNKHTLGDEERWEQPREDRG